MRNVKVTQTGRIRPTKLNKRKNEKIKKKIISNLGDEPCGIVYQESIVYVCRAGSLPENRQNAQHSAQHNKRRWLHHHHTHKSVSLYQ